MPQSCAPFDVAGFGTCAAIGLQELDYNTCVDAAVSTGLTQTVVNVTNASHPSACQYDKNTREVFYNEATSTAPCTIDIPCLCARDCSTPAPALPAPATAMPCPNPVQYDTSMGTPCTTPVTDSATCLAAANTLFPTPISSVLSVSDPKKPSGCVFVSMSSLEFNTAVTGVKCSLDKLGRYSLSRQVGKHTTLELVDSAVFVAAALLGGSAAAPSAALLLLMDTSCDGREKQLSWIHHPTRLEAAGSQSLGAVIGNAWLVVLATLLVRSLVSILPRTRLVTGKSTFVDVRAMLRYPGGPLFLHMLWYQGSVYAAQFLAFHPKSAASAAFGGCSMAALVATPLLIAAKIAEDVPREGRQGRAYYRPDYQLDSALWRFVAGSGEWVSASPSVLWVQRYQTMVKSYRQACAWFVVVDFFGMALVATVTAVAPDEMIMCGHQRLVLCLISLAALAIEVTFWPHAKARSDAADCARLAFQSAALLFLSIGFYTEDPGHWAFDASGTCFTLTVAVLLATVLLDCVNEVYLFKTGRKGRLQEEAFKENCEMFRPGGDAVEMSCEGTLEQSMLMCTGGLTADSWEEEQDEEEPCSESSSSMCESARFWPEPSDRSDGGSGSNIPSESLFTSSSAVASQVATTTPVRASPKHRSPYRPASLVHLPSSSCSMSSVGAGLKLVPSEDEPAFFDAPVLLVPQNSRASVSSEQKPAPNSFDAHLSTLSEAMEAGDFASAAIAFAWLWNNHRDAPSVTDAILKHHPAADSRAVQSNPTQFIRAACKARRAPRPASSPYSSVCTRFSHEFPQSGSWEEDCGRGGASFFFDRRTSGLAAPASPATHGNRKITRGATPASTPCSSPLGPKLSSFTV
ncbi:hypothetical protein DIPPA_06982 [Diplonema papillatum]|nr:hypothetical protein DIPPA_06982 [Diplonema papillatum]